MSFNSVTNPHAAVIVWNYADRISATGANSSVHNLQEVIISTYDLVSISTSKRKSSPAGAFEIQLAPTQNWVATITPGSWCAILMSRDTKISNLQIGSPNVGKAKWQTFKMLGRIESVRMAAKADPDTGAISTQYVMNGQDWGGVFETSLYIDPLLKSNNLEKLGYVGHAAKILLDTQTISWGTQGKLPSTDQMLKSIIELWGLDVTNSLAQTSQEVSTLTSLQTSSDAQFKLPVRVASFMHQDTGLGQTAVNFANLIQLYSGKLTSYDKYDMKSNSYGIPDPTSFYKVNKFWQLLVDNSNVVINELVTDIRWETKNGQAVPVFALYQRVKPFINRYLFEGYKPPIVKLNVHKNVSRFKNVRRIKIALTDVISINAGTNWRDTINFVEIRLQPQLFQETYSNEVKNNSQTFDRKAIEREGFKPMMPTCYHVPLSPTGTEADFMGALDWKYLLREWYFNTHLLLNGVVSIVGQDSYIQVGDNISIPAEVFGKTNFSITHLGTKANPNAKIFFLAHVESVSHSFVVSPENGARSFTTSIQFSRGLLVDQSLNPLFSIPPSPENPLVEGAIDTKAGALSVTQAKYTTSIPHSNKEDPHKA